jgi:hypothetical protein
VNAGEISAYVNADRLPRWGGRTSADSRRRVRQREWVISQFLAFGADLELQHQGTARQSGRLADRP